MVAFLGYLSFFYAISNLGIAFDAYLYFLAAIIVLLECFLFSCCLYSSKSGCVCK